jgi:hypothetical protein
LATMGLSPVTIVIGVYLNIVCISVVASGMYRRYFIISLLMPPLALWITQKENRP